MTPIRSLLMAAAVLCPGTSLAQGLPPGILDAVTPSSGAVEELPAGAFDPVNRARVCDALGQGFILIPETQTCVKISVGVRTDFSVHMDLGGSNGRSGRPLGSNTASEGRINSTTHTPTQFGPLRTHVDMRVRTGRFND